MRQEAESQFKLIDGLQSSDLLQIFQTGKSDRVSLPLVGYMAEKLIAKQFASHGFTAFTNVLFLQESAVEKEFKRQRQCLRKQMMEH